MKRQTQQLMQAVAYIRMSSDKQEASPAQQRAALKKLAESQGFEIVREYFDKAVSGAGAIKRKQFRQMIVDAEECGDFEAILTWDVSRFGRFDSIDAGEWIAPLRRADVKLVTMTEGEIDWSSFTGRLIYSVHTEGANQYLVNLARTTLRGKLASVKEGHYVAASAPYGYDRMLVDEEGRHQQRLKDAGRLVRPRSWYVTLVPSDDEQKVETVRWIFESYGDGLKSYWAVANELNANGVPSPKGGIWSRQHVSRILKNQIYCGDLVWNRSSKHRFAKVSGGDIQTSKGVKKSEEKNAVEDWVVVPNAHQPLISKELFDKVQRRISHRRRSPTKTKGRPPFVLHGILFCGHCGAKMNGKSSRAKSGKEYKVFRSYVCPRAGGHGSSVCGHKSINEAKITEYITQVIKKRVLTEGFRQGVRQELERTVKEKSQKQPQEARSLRRQLNSISAKIERGAENILLADAELIPAMQAKLVEWRRERDGLQERLNRLPGSEAQMQNEKHLVAAAMAQMDDLRGALDNADPSLVQAALADTIERVDLYFAESPKTKKVYSYFQRGVVTLQPGFELSQVSRTPEYRFCREAGRRSLPCSVRSEGSSNGNRGADHCESRKDTD